VPEPGTKAGRYTENLAAKATFAAIAAGRKLNCIFHKFGSAIDASKARNVATVSLKSPRPEDSYSLAR